MCYCTGHMRHRAALCAKIAHLPEADGTPPILTDEDGIVALLREDFLGGAKEAASAADAFLHNVALFRKMTWSSLGDDCCLILLAFTTTVFALHV